MLLKELSQAIGVSGDEGAVRAIIRDAIADHVTDMQTDSMGNLTAFKHGTGERSLRVMLDAHMDEVGFMVMGYDNDGMIRFSNVGGIDPRIMPGARLKVGKNALDGVVLSTPIHHSQDQNAIALKDLRIDIGATSKANAESLVSIGERIAFASEYAELSETVVRGKAFDNRVGCALLIDVLRGGQYPVDVVVSFSTQEEVGLRGARVAAHRLQPDVAIALEGTTAHDVPLGDADPDNLLKPNPVCRLGGGPVLTVIDASMIAHPRLLAFMRQTATDAGIPYQLKTAPGGGTDAGAIHLSRAGVPSAVVSMPCRYIHSPHAYLSKTDYQHALALVQAALRQITPEVLV
jgi:endoglucanase